MNVFHMATLFCSVLMLNTAVYAQASLQKIEAGSGEVCYLPTQSNVAYKDVLALPVESPDHVISYGADQYQFAELWLPKQGLPKQGLPSEGAMGDSESESALPKPIDYGEPIRRHPLVILVHGGCWLNAFDIKHTHALSTALKRAGYAVWSIEYRRTGDQGGAWPGSYNDIKSAISHLSKLQEYPINFNKVAIAGHSAGGHLALLAGSDKLYDFDAVIGLAAITDIVKYSRGDNSCQVATQRFMGGSVTEFPARYAAANPAVKSPHPSTVLIHGSIDSIVAPAHANYIKNDSHILEGAGHFDMVHPGTPSYQALLKELAKAFR